METKVLKAAKNSYKLAKAILKGKGIVAFPTETVYGLGANAYCHEAVEKIFKAKGRPSDNPLIVHLDSVKKIDDICMEINETARKIIKAFMPGPLTIVLKKSPKISDLVTCGLDTVGVRVPKNRYARKLLKVCGLPIAAPSANVSGRPSPTLAKHVLADLDGKVPLIIDGGSCDVGIESTVVDATNIIPVILRPGKITPDDIKKVCGNVSILNKTDVIKSPGIKYKHYAPKCDVYLFESGDFLRAEKFIKDMTRNRRKVLVICEKMSGLNCNNAVEYIDHKTLAKKLYSFFREYEQVYDIILIEKPDDFGIGSSILNRLEKASGGKIVE